MSSGLSTDLRKSALFAWYTPGHSDRLGDRLRLFDNTDGPPLELLRLRPDFARGPAFDRSLRSRIAELHDFRHDCYARVLRADWLPEPGGGLAVVSEQIEGPRLFEILQLAEQRGVLVPAALTLALLAGLVDAVAALHARGPSFAHGALGPERLVVAGDGRLRVTEYVLGSALAGLPLERERAWRDFGLALPPDPAVAPFDQRTDVFQIGTIALALALSRPLAADDYPARLAALCHEADRRAVVTGCPANWSLFRLWMERALCLGGATPFGNAIEASEALSTVAGSGARPEGPAWGRFEISLRLREARKSWEDSFPSEAEIPSAALAALDASLARTPPPQDATPPESVASPRLALPVPTTDVPSPTPAVSSPELPVGRGRRPRVLLILLACLTLVAGGQALYIGSRAMQGRGANDRPLTGTAHIESEPPGALIAVDGKPAGRTPASLSLAAGRHSVALTVAGKQRTVSVEAKAGATTSLVVDLGAEASVTGQLRVATDPPGGRVTVDGVPRGTSPVIVTGLAAGAHDVVVEGRGRSVRQVVTMEAGSTAALVLPLPNADAPAPGWLTVRSPVEVQIYRDGELLGTSRSPRVMLAAGRYAVDLVNEGVDLRVRREVVVPVGKTTTLELEMPSARVDINATPWAEVLIDGERIGDTPLSGVAVPIGPHVVTFRHRTLGERRVECLVGLNRPTRLSVDLRK